MVSVPIQNRVYKLGMNFNTHNSGINFTSGGKIEEAKSLL